MPVANPNQENIFWQSIVDSTNPVMFEAYLAQFPNGVFRPLAEVRLMELRASGSDLQVANRSPAEAAGRVAAESTPATAEPAIVERAAPPPLTEQRCHEKYLFNCWMPLASDSACWVWISEAWAHSADWNGDCSDGLAEGPGTLTVRLEGKDTVHTGSLLAGKKHDEWVIRHSAGMVERGPYQYGIRHGAWVVDYANGDIAKGSYEYDERAGEWRTYTDGKLSSIAEYEGGGVSIRFIE